jgi:hypothetical protein
LAKTEALDNLRKRNAAQLAIDTTEYYAAHVAYVHRLYGSTLARMNGKPLRLVPSESKYPRMLPSKMPG